MTVRRVAAVRGPSDPLLTAAPLCLWQLLQRSPLLLPLHRRPIQLLQRQPVDVEEGTRLGDS